MYIEREGDQTFPLDKYIVRYLASPNHSSPLNQYRVKDQNLPSKTFPLNTYPELPAEV